MTQTLGNGKKFTRSKVGKDDKLMYESVTMEIGSGVRGVWTSWNIGKTFCSSLGNLTGRTWNAGFVHQMLSPILACCKPDSLRVTSQV